MGWEPLRLNDIHECVAKIGFFLHGEHIENLGFSANKELSNAASIVDGWGVAVNSVSCQGFLLLVHISGRVGDLKCFLRCVEVVLWQSRVACGKVSLMVFTGGHPNLCCEASKLRGNCSWCQAQEVALPMSDS